MGEARFTSKADEEFFGAIGRLTISWAHLELGIDCIVELLYVAFDGKAIEPEIPRSLRRKIAFMRGTIKKLPIGAAAIEGFLGLLDRIQTASETRHDIIHGVIVEQAERSGEAIMARATRDKRGVTKRQFKVTTLSILKAASEAQKLGGIVLKWATDTQRLIHELSQQAPSSPH